MGEVKSLFGADDAELSQLLSQAKQDLARNAAPTTTQAPTDRVALTVPFRLATSDRPLLQLDPQTGTARIDPTARHTPLDTNAQPVDPTVRRKSPSELAREKDQTAGKRWFGMAAPVLTPELKNNLRVLQLRNVLDPKRFYKKDGALKKMPKYFEMGTVVEGPTEFYSGRMTRKERKSNLVDELLADKGARDYFKRKVGEIHAHNESGGKNWYRARMGGGKGKGGNGKGGSGKGGSGKGGDRGGKHGDRGGNKRPRK
ncbi:hypothetical protein LPJ62_003225 [Coemansia sp. RSA 2167]|nr:hypothetical protein LPJ62_003225 [Coemansia sp. RSA 2167]KAJ2152853.1 hypothetical protein J3F82_002397 [Coemansia sp. RSA 637]KAJ2536501.1 hypothetical protein IWW43_000795 [Coemansia sp. RSA 1935]